MVEGDANARAVEALLTARALPATPSASIRTAFFAIARWDTDPLERIRSETRVARIQILSTRIPRDIRLLCGLADTFVLVPWLGFHAYIA
jgi:hypothetical protein